MRRVVIVAGLLVGGCNGGSADETTVSSSVGTDDSGQSTDSGQTSSVGTSMDVSTTGSTSATTDDGTSITPATETADTSGTSGDTSESSTGTQTTGGVQCPDPLPRPLAPELVTDVLSNSYDLAFDGRGQFAAKQGDALVLVDSTGTTGNLTALSGIVYGLAFEPDGNLLAALPAEDRIVRISPQGATSDVATAVDFPSNIHVDAQGQAWISFPGMAAVVRLDAGDTLTTVVSGAGATAAGGVAYDTERSLLWLTHYDAGQLRVTPIDAQGQAGTVDVAATIDGRLNGLALDACGHVYGIDDLNSRLYRFTTDDTGAVVGDPQVLAEFGNFVFNAEFGRGAGFSETSIYAVGEPGSVFAVDVGIPGA